ncbi:hypothetical protein AML37_23455 [Escherichia coli]|nr:hypothetical protein AML37_23455 [Escherichia coli]
MELPASDTHQSGNTKNQENLPRPVIDRAWDAQLRLCKRSRKLQAKEKNVNITIVAVAREQVVLSGIWGGIAMFVAQ